MQRTYREYLNERGSTYMQGETGGSREWTELDRKAAELSSGEGGQEGYAGVALDVIEGLLGVQPRAMILNVPNRGVIHGMGEDDVVEVPAFVGRDRIEPLGVGAIPAHCLGLMQSVKAYERLAIEAAVGGSYQKALTALAIHPLVADYDLAKVILDEYIQGHAGYFPALA
jgi:6-phospho-beta-glucosidase